jgi:Zn-dependent peptidase ImmA (M78 family)
LLVRWRKVIALGAPGLPARAPLAREELELRPRTEALDELVKAIVGLLQSKRTATFATPSDLPLDEEGLRLIRSHAKALLKEADALGRRPTPLEDIQEAARLVLTGEITLEPGDKRRLVAKFGRWVELAWKRLQGTFDSRASAIWVKPDLHPMKRRFVLSHEIAHAILPAHKKTFAYVDDYTRLPPFSRDLYEREANQAAAEILFQAGELTDEFDASAPSLQLICDLSVAFGGSIVAAARLIAWRLGRTEVDFPELRLTFGRRRESIGRQRKEPGRAACTQRHRGARNATGGLHLRERLSRRPS